MGCCRRNFHSSSLRPRKRIQTRSSVPLIEVRSRRDLAVRSEHICERSLDSASTPTQAVKEFASAPPALRATSPSMGRTNFSPSGAARHLPMNGRTGYLGGGGRLQLAAGRFHLLQRLYARLFFHRRAQV